MTIAPELDALLAKLDRMSADDLPRLLGDLRHVEVAALARLNAAVAVGRTVQEKDRLLHIEEAAQLLGMSRGWLYRQKDRMPFTRRVGNRVRFSANAIAEFIADQKPNEKRRIVRFGQ